MSMDKLLDIRPFVLALPKTQHTLLLQKIVFIYFILFYVFPFVYSNLVCFRTSVILSPLIYIYIFFDK